MAVTQTDATADSTDLDRSDESAYVARCPNGHRTVIKKRSRAFALQKRYTCPDCDSAYGVSCATARDFEQADRVSDAVSRPE